MVVASLSRHFCIIRGQRTIQSILHNCVICRCIASKPHPQIMGQLPPDRLNPGPIFDRVGVDYSRPITIKSGSIRKPTITKSYVADFVCFSVKTVHLEMASSLTTVAFTATLCHFIDRRGKPSMIWSDHETNFVGAAKELKQLMENPETWQAISNYCSNQGIQWKFIPEQSPHFGGLWEAAVKSFKFHLEQIVADVKVNFEQLTTITIQTEACLYSWSLTQLPENTNEIETPPSHFMIEHPLEVLPYPSSSR